MKLWHGIEGVELFGEPINGVTSLEISREGGDPEITYFLGHPYAIHKQNAESFSIKITAFATNKNLYFAAMTNSARGDAGFLDREKEYNRPLVLYLSTEEKEEKSEIQIYNVVLTSVDFDGSSETDSDSVEPLMMTFNLTTLNPFRYDI